MINRLLPQFSRARRHCPPLGRPPHPPLYKVSVDNTLALISDRALFDLITSKDTSLVARMFKARSHLDVSVAGSSRSYSSLILEVADENDYFVIDDLCPGGLPDRLIDTRPAIRITAVLDREEIDFESEITATAARDGKRYHRVVIPDELHHHKRRRWARIPVAMAPRTTVTLRREGHRSLTNLTGLIRDVSAGGFRATVTGIPNEGPPMIGEQFKRCCVTPPAASPIISTVNVCHVNRLPVGNTYTIGVEYQDAPRPEIAARIVAGASE